MTIMMTDEFYLLGYSHGKSDGFREVRHETDIIIQTIYKEVGRLQAKLRELEFPEEVKQMQCEPEQVLA